jgi:hypothetical protein
MDDARGRFDEKYRLVRDFVAQFLDMIQVIAPDTDDLSDRIGGRRPFEFDLIHRSLALNWLIILWPFFLNPKPAAPSHPKTRSAAEQ